MRQEQLLTADYIESQIGNVIEYYIRWEFEEDPFYGKARIKGLVDDEAGGLKIICDVIEGSDLELAYEQEEVCSCTPTITRSTPASSRRSIRPTG